MKKINESFVCENCKRTVPSANKTCRNHCPWCFLSIHVDGEIPGDRDTSCGSQMIPLHYEITNGETKIYFRCTTCTKEHHNKACEDDDLGNLDEKIAGWKQKYPNLI